MSVAFSAAMSCGGEGSDDDGIESWSEAASMPIARGEGSAALGLRDEGCQNPPCQVVAVAGGFSFPARTQARVDGYLPDEDRWIELPALPEPRHHLAATGLADGTLMVSGGAPSATDESPRDEVWALGPGDDQWRTLDPLPEPRWGHRMVTVGDQVVSVGGHGAETTFVWQFEQGWSSAAPIPESRDHLGAVVVDDQIWVIAGRDDEITSRVDIYDVDDDTWRDGVALPEPTSAAAVGVVDNHVVVVSGERAGSLRGGIVDRSWMLDLDGDEPHWKPLSPPPTDVHGASDAVVGTGEDRRLLIFGGATWHAEWSTLSWTSDVQVLDRLQPESQ